MSTVPPSPRGIIVVGYILPPKEEAQRNQDDGSDEDDEEEEEDPEFLDMGEMESLSDGGRCFQSSVPPRLDVNFQILDSNQELHVEGRFPLTDPWWQITCQVKLKRVDRAVLQGYPSYTLRRDLKGEDKRSIVALFLKACGASDHVTEFMEWLQQTETDVGLDTLPEALEEFEEVEQHKAAAVHIKSLISKSVAGGCVHAATHYPLVMKHLPTLLPRKFKELLGMGKKRDRDSLYETSEAGLSSDLLESLEDIIETEVWKLGFSFILYKELHLIRCEAHLEAFVACGLYRSIPELQRHALQVYEQLNRQCQLSGSTYVERCDLEGLLRPDLAEVSVWAAVHFLKEQGVVVLERQRVALQNLHSYETGIEKRLGRLIRGDGESEPWRIQLDVKRVLREAQEERLRARAQAEAGKDTPGEGSDGAGTPEQNDKMAAENATKEEPSSDPAFAHRETSTQAVLSSGGSSWDDLNFDLKCSLESQREVPPTLTEPSHGDADNGDPPVQIELDPDQVRAGEMICSNPVTVISGKGGCGKTTVVSLVFKAALQQRDKEMEEVLKACEDFKNDPGDSQFLSQMDPQVNEETTEEDKKKKKEEEKEEKLEVLLTAPTGRAAGLLTKRTGITAYTMHQVLVSYMNWKRLKDKGQPKEGENLRWKFRRVRALVVDEGSLVSVQILHSLLSILINEARLQKFILLGDVRQLPSIEPGNTLYDLFHSLRKVQWSIEMRTNHRAESQLIVDNAGCIADMGQKRTYYPLNFDAVVDMNFSPEVPSADKRFIYVRVSDNDCALQDSISLLLRRGPGLQDHQVSQFIAFRRNDCALINELCCQHYVGHATKNFKNRIDFRVGDKICCTRNSYVTDRKQERSGTKVSPPDQQVAMQTQVGGCPLPSDPLEGGSDGRTQQTEWKERKRKEEEEKERLKERLCNGEIFYITEDVTVEEEGRRKRRYLTLDDGQGRELCVLFREVQRLCRIRHAWARTIHTFQGSEADTIVYVVGSGVAQDWRHVYTAVTRGQKRVYVVSKDADLEKAIRGHVRKRNTRLGQLVRELVAEHRSGEEDPLSQTQPCPGTPLKQEPGFQASSQTSSQTPGPSTMHRDLQQEYVDPNLITRDACLEDDINFSQAYNWCSPMECADNTAALSSNAGVSGTVETAIAKERDSFRELSNPPESPLGVKRIGGSQSWNTPPKQLRVAAAHTPTGASSLGLLTLNSPSPAPVVKHLFPKETGESPAAPSPVKFRPRVGLSQRFAAAAVSREEGRGGGEGPSSSHPREACPSSRVPGSDRPLETSNSTVPLAVKYPDLISGPCEDMNTKETCLQDDLAFTQEYSWPPMSGEDEDPSAVPHGTSRADGVEETDLLQDLFSS